MQNVEIMEMLSKIKFSFNLIDIEILTHTHIMKYSAHKFHCDLWHAFLTVFANAISLHHFDSILFHFVDRRTYRAKCAKISSVRWNCLVWFFSYLHYITIRCMDFVSYWKKIQRPLCHCMMFNMANYYTCSVFSTKYSNTWIMSTEYT